LQLFQRAGLSSTIVGKLRCCLLSHY